MCALLPEVIGVVAFLQPIINPVREVVKCLISNVSEAEYV